MRELRADAARPRHHVYRAAAHVAGHLTPLEHVPLITEHLGQVRFEREAAHEHDRALAQRGEHPVTFAQCKAERHRYGFLTRARAVKANPTLALEGLHAFVDAANAAQRPVKLELESGSEFTHR